MVNKYIANQQNAARRDKESLEKDVKQIKGQYEEFKNSIIESLQDGNEEEILNFTNKPNQNQNQNQSQNNSKNSSTKSSFSSESSEPTNNNNKEGCNGDDKKHHIEPEKAADLISRYIIKCRKLINEVCVLQSDKDEFLKKVGIDDYDSVSNQLDDSHKLIEQLTFQLKEGKKKRNQMRLQVKKIISN